jgi:hypothetical protein
MGRSGRGTWGEGGQWPGEVCNELALEVASVARARLIEIEVMLREFWDESLDNSPVVAARINVAAQWVHRAADTLAPETLQ